MMLLQKYRLPTVALSIILYLQWVTKDYLSDLMVIANKKNKMLTK